MTVDPAAPSSKPSPLAVSGDAGYAHLEYARSLAEFGRLVNLPACGGFLLARSIANTPHEDAMGCYPMFACARWDALSHDLEALEKSLVSVSLVPDPFGAYESRQLDAAFEHVALFKHHFVVDLATPLGRIGSRHHRRNAAKALRHVAVEVIDSPAQYGSEWVKFYFGLMKRQSVTGIRAFSARSLTLQLEVPGATMFRGAVGGRTVGFDLWYESGDVAYFHLGALDEEGYAVSASHALKLVAIEYFRERIGVLDLGGGVGLTPQPDDGLVRFKEGWSTATMPVYFCGRVLDQPLFDAISASSGRVSGSYFPPYRMGEFA